MSNNINNLKQTQLLVKEMAQELQSLSIRVGDLAAVQSGDASPIGGGGANKGLALSIQGLQEGLREFEGRLAKLEGITKDDGAISLLETVSLRLDQIEKVIGETRSANSAIRGLSATVAQLARQIEELQKQ